MRKYPIFFVNLTDGLNKMTLLTQSPSLLRILELLLVVYM